MGIMYAMAICIPLLGLAFLLFKVGWKVKPIDDRKRVGLFLAVTLIPGVGIATLLYVGGTSKANFNEVWNYKGNEVRYYEDWNERVSCRHPKYCTRTVSSTDSKGRSTSRTETYQCGWQHLYDVDYHPEHWTVLNEYGRQERITKPKYHKWVGIFTEGKQTFKDLNRSYHTDDGDMYYSTWPGQFERMMPLHTVKSYKNKVRVSHSTFNYPEPTEELAAKYPRPADEGNTNPIISYGPSVSGVDQLLMRRINAKWGSRKQIHCMIILFHGESVGIVSEVLSAWNGPNKNELAVFVGLDKDTGKVSWTDVHSWMDDTTIHARVRSDVASMGEWNVSKMAGILDAAIPEQWNRKEFADFNYIKIPISMGWFLTNFLLSVAITIGAGFWLHLKWDQFKPRQFPRIRRRRHGTARRFN